MVKKYIKDRMMEYFLANPSARLRVRGIERELKLPLPSVIRYCKELKKQGILAIEKIGDVNFYTADRTSEMYILEKKLYNLRNIYLSGIIEYLKQELSNPAIVLFGSYARGEDTEDSDIDLYIETPSQKKVNIEKFENKLKRSLQLFQHKSLGRISNQHLANNIANGITLNNNIEVF